VSYATDGTDFYVGIINNNSYKITPGGEASIFFEYSEVSNIFFRSNGGILVQTPFAELYYSDDGGLQWKKLEAIVPNTKLYFFEITGNLYFAAMKQIFKVKIGESSIEFVELDNSVLDTNISYITSVSDYDSKVYVTTMGEGVFYKTLEEFDND
jgi:hypothetical protein